MMHSLTMSDATPYCCVACGNVFLSTWGMCGNCSSRYIGDKRTRELAAYIVRFLRSRNGASLQAKIDEDGIERLQGELEMIVAHGGKPPNWVEDAERAPMPAVAPTKAWADLAAGDRVFLSLPAERGTINAARGFADAEFLIVFDANRPDEWVERWRVTPEGRGADDASRATSGEGSAKAGQMPGAEEPDFATRAKSFMSSYLRRADPHYLVQSDVDEMRVMLKAAYDEGRRAADGSGTAPTPAQERLAEEGARDIGIQMCVTIAAMFVDAGKSATDVYNALLKAQAGQSAPMRGVTPASIKRDLEALYAQHAATPNPPGAMYRDRIRKAQECMDRLGAVDGSCLPDSRAPGDAFAFIDRVWMSKWEDMGWHAFGPKRATIEEAQADMPREHAPKPPVLACKHPAEEFRHIEMRGSLSLQRLATWCSACGALHGDGGSLHDGAWSTPSAGLPTMWTDAEYKRMQRSRDDALGELLTLRATITKAAVALAASKVADGSCCFRQAVLNRLKQKAGGLPEESAENVIERLIYETRLVTGLTQPRRSTPGDEPHTCSMNNDRVLDFKCNGCLADLHTGGHDGDLAERLDWARRSSIVNKDLEEADKKLEEMTNLLEVTRQDRDRLGDRATEASMTNDQHCAERDALEAALKTIVRAKMQHAETIANNALGDLGSRQKKFADECMERQRRKQADAAALAAAVLARKEFSGETPKGSAGC